MSILRPEHTVAVGVGVAAVDLLIFSMHVPSVADIRVANPANLLNPAKPGNPDVEAARRQAVIYSVGFNGLISLITRDWDVFLIGGIVTVAMSYMVAHANAVNPLTGKMAGTPSELGSGSYSVSADYSLPDYSMNENTG